MTDGSLISLQYRSMSKGACHIAFYHMVSVGKGSVWIDGRWTSQFSKMLTSYQMAVVANTVISKGPTRYDAPTGNYVNGISIGNQPL